MITKAGKSICIVLFAHTILSKFWESYFVYTLPGHVAAFLSFPPRFWVSFVCVSLNFWLLGCYFWYLIAFCFKKLQVWLQKLLWITMELLPNEHIVTWTYHKLKCMYRQTHRAPGENPVYSMTRGWGFLALLSNWRKYRTSKPRSTMPPLPSS